MSLFFLHCAGQLLTPSDEKIMSCLSSLNFFLFNLRFFKKTSPCFLFMRVLVLAGCPLCVCLFLSYRPSLCLTSSRVCLFLSCRPSLCLTSSRVCLFFSCRPSLSHNPHLGRSFHFVFFAFCCFLLRILRQSLNF